MCVVILHVLYAICVWAPYRYIYIFFFLDVYIYIYMNIYVFFFCVLFVLTARPWCSALGPKVAVHSQWQQEQEA